MAHDARHLYDQLIGVGAARGMKFVLGGNRASARCTLPPNAVENQWPRPIEIEEHFACGHGNAYEAGAANLPFAAISAAISAPTCPR